MIELTTIFIALVPMVIGIVEVIKRTFAMSSRYAPLMSLLVGIASVYIYNDFVISSANILQGVVLGLTAAGLYSGTKKTFEDVV